MQFTCTKENLVHALDDTSSVANKQTNLPILNNVLFRSSETKVECLSTNLELAVVSQLRAKVEKPGEFTVPAKTMSEYVRLLSDEQVTLALEGNELLVTCGSTSTKIKGTPADEFPVLPEPTESDVYGLLVEPLRDALSKAVVAVAKNEIRPELAGVFFGFFTDRYKGLVLAATDSYRLAEKKVSVGSGDKSRSVIVPARAVFELIRLLGRDRGEESNSQVNIGFSDTQFIVKYGTFELTSRLIDGTYPDYAQIIPDSYKTTTTFPVDILIQKIKAASLFTTTGVNAVSFDLNAGKNSIGVSSTSSQKGEHSAELDVEVSGEENSILLNHRYVLDGLQLLKGQVELCVNSADSPCLFKEQGHDDYVYIVMPIRQ